MQDVLDWKQSVHRTVTDISTPDDNSKTTIIKSNTVKSNLEYALLISANLKRCRPKKTLHSYTGRVNSSVTKSKE